jgi:hypothetical protein
MDTGIPAFSHHERVLLCSVGSIVASWRLLLLQPLRLPCRFRLPGRRIVLGCLLASCWGCGLRLTVESWSDKIQPNHTNIYQERGVRWTRILSSIDFDLHLELCYSPMAKRGFLSGRNPWGSGRVRTNKQAANACELKELWFDYSNFKPSTSHTLFAAFFMYFYAKCIRHFCVLA